MCRPADQGGAHPHKRHKRECRLSVNSPQEHSYFAGVRGGESRPSLLLHIQILISHPLRGLLVELADLSFISIMVKGGANSFISLWRAVFPRAQRQTRFLFFKAAHHNG